MKFRNIIGFIVFTLLCILFVLVSCDNRTPNSSLKIYSDTNIVYTNDQTPIPITCIYISNNKYNKRIYFKTNNGMIRELNTTEPHPWTSSQDTLHIQVDINGQCKLQYKHPAISGISTIYTWTYIYNNSMTAVQEILSDSLNFNVLQR